VFSSAAGKLPAADAASLAGIPLPPGRIVHAGGRLSVAWISTTILPAEHLNDLVRHLAAAFAATGLWPLRAVGLHDGELDRPWDDGELEGPVGEVPDALTVLRRADDPDAEQGEVPPVTALAPATSGPELLAEHLVVDAGALLLVPVRRPADVVAALGWWGATNHDRSGADITAVLRSWEDRFGAVLVSMGFDTMVVQVPRRPATPSEVDELLREHYAFCPDVIDQGVEAEGYRARLAEWPHWHFWWD
jgi:hypothetical protein